MSKIHTLYERTCIALCDEHIKESPLKRALTYGFGQPNNAVTVVVIDNKSWPEPHTYGAYLVILAGESPYIRSCTVYMCGSDQSYVRVCMCE